MMTPDDMSLEDQIVQVLEKTKDQIRQNMAEKGIDATGRTSLSVRVVRDGSSIKLVGGGTSSKWGGKTAPFETVEIGRGPGGEWLELRPIIYHWTIAKDIQTQSDSHRWAIATNIAKRIVKQGTRRHSIHEDVYTTPVTEAEAEIRQIVGKSFRNFFQALAESVTIETNTNDL